MEQCRQRVAQWVPCQELAHALLALRARRPPPPIHTQRAALVANRVVAYNVPYASAVRIALRAFSARAMAHTQHATPICF